MKILMVVVLVVVARGRADVKPDNTTPVAQSASHLGAGEGDVVHRREKAE